MEEVVLPAPIHYNRRMAPKLKAFSLVELSIVLVILGLLVGGLLAGQSLIRAAELRKLTTSVNRYQTAMHAFRDKYFALPGDMANATRFWDVAGGDGTGIDSTCYSTASTDAKTCNGNGDGVINDTLAAVAGEPGRAWQQLANAGMLEGSYNGAYTKTSLAANNVPTGGVGNTGIVVSGPWMVGAYTVAWSTWNLAGYNYLYTTSFPTALAGAQRMPSVSLKPEEA